MANKYLTNFIKYSPLMGIANKSSLDIDPITVLEITDTQALRDLMEAGHLT